MLPTSQAIACGTSSRVRRSACSRTSSATSSSSGWSLCWPSGKYTGPGGMAAASRAEHLAEAVAAQRRDAAARPPAVRPRASSRRAPSCGAVQQVGLVQREHRRHVGARRPRRRCSGRRRRTTRRVEQHQGGVHLAERVVDRRLHLARQRVERLLKAGQVEQHDLHALDVHHPGDAAARGLRVVGDDAHLAARRAC